MAIQKLFLKYWRYHYCLLCGNPKVIQRLFCVTPLAFYTYHTPFNTENMTSQMWTASRIYNTIR